MKTPVLFGLVVALIALVEATPAGKGQKYTTKYDNINVEDILRNERLFNNYFKCLLDKGPCTPDGQELKSNLKDALQSKCSKCSQKQKEGSKVVIKHLIEKRPQQFEALEKKYDPKGVYRALYKAEAAKMGIKV